MGPWVTAEEATGVTAHGDGRLQGNGTSWNWVVVLGAGGAL